MKKRAKSTAKKGNTACQRYKPPLKKFKGSLLQRLRETSGLYRHEVEAQIPLTRGLLSLWETGCRRPNRANLDKLCAFFDVDGHVFCDDTAIGSFQNEAETELRAMFWKYLHKETDVEHKFALRIYDVISKQRTEQAGNDVSDIAESVGHLVRGLVRSGHVHVNLDEKE